MPLRDEAREIAESKAREIAALDWAELDTYGRRRETATTRSGEPVQVESQADWDMEEWASGVNIVVRVRTRRGVRRFWPWKAVAGRGGPDDLVPPRPDADDR